ncbi:MAG: DUF1385 domain-containing protein [Firmicutes bacterium]|nr:DUF1385 domain-containing protein [Bacillota bacterium]
MKEQCKIKTSIGGQALIEGVMMRGPKKTVAAVRNTEGALETKDFSDQIRQHPKWMRLPFIRGVVSFIDSMKLGYTTLMYSAEVSAGTDAEPESKFDLWLEKKLGDKTMKVLGTVASLLGVALAVVLFLWLPAFLFNLIPGAKESAGLGWWRSVFEGMFRLVILVAYMALVSRLPDMRRVFQYHGAEHKTIFCYESLEELTVENVKKHSRFHPRCGTSFLVLMLLVGIVIGFFIRTPNTLLRTVIRLLLLPVTMGVGYELIKLCGRHNNLFTRIIAAPGLWMQRITTKEPDDGMIEAAICALQAVVPENGEDRL